MITKITDLTEQTTAAAADQIPLGSQANGTRRISVTNLSAAIAALLPKTNGMETAYNSPVTGASVAVIPVTAGNSVWLPLTPVGTLATLTIVLPGDGSTGGSVAADNQEILLNTTQTLTLLTVTSVGKTVSAGIPTTLAQFGIIRMRYNAVLNTWFKV